MPVIRQISNWANEHGKRILWVLVSGNPGPMECELIRRYGEIPAYSKCEWRKIVEDIG